MTTHYVPADTSPATSTPVNAPVPAPVNRLAAVVGVLVLAPGIAGGILHIELFFVPALVVLAVAGVKLWREQSGPGGRYQR
jgi:hypothetical protein